PRHRLPHLYDARRDGRQVRPAAAVLRVAWPVRLACPSERRARPAAARAGGLRSVGGAMIVLYNPLSTTPGKQPLPLSLMALAAVLEASEPWTLVDGNLVADPAAEIIARLSDVPGALTPLLAVSVMPGPQLTQAVAVCARVKAALPHVPVGWGGCFPTQHAETVLRAPYVDFVIRSQGELALLQLIKVLRTGGLLNSVGGLSWKAGSAKA